MGNFATTMRLNGALVNETAVGVLAPVGMAAFSLAMLDLRWLGSSRSASGTSGCWRPSS